MKKLLVFIFIIVSSGSVTIAQKSKQDTVKGINAIITKAQYTCTMHPEVTSDKPGKCPKCNMELTLTKKEQMKTDVMNNYTCPMHANLVSNQPGKCPTCNSNLVLSKKEQMKMEVMRMYTCPMHPDQLSDKSGKCPTCGMALAAKKTNK